MSESFWSGEAAEMVACLGSVAPSVAAAMRKVPRHQFVDPSMRRQAYLDEPLPLKGGFATISAPHMVALQLEWADLRAGLNVLEIGLGSGYLTALTAEMVGPTGHVHGVELDPLLAREAGARLRSLGYSTGVYVHQGDGQEGWPPDSPYDRILVSCASPRILPGWVAQTVIGGTVIAPVGGPYSQTLVRYRHHEGEGVVERGPECRFVALRKLSSPRAEGSRG